MGRLPADDRPREPGGTELRPSGDFARLVLREIEPDDYGRRRRWTALDREFAALVWLERSRERTRLSCRLAAGGLAVGGVAALVLAGPWPG